MRPRVSTARQAPEGQGTSVDNVISLVIKTGFDAVGGPYLRELIQMFWL
jgi:hypothetical protein